jgi:hypothetical protein
MPEQQAPYNTANETLSLEEFNRKYGDKAQPQLEDLGAPADEFEQAVAIDPGKTAGLAWTNGHRVITNSVSDFWAITTGTWMEIFAVPGPSDLFAGPEDLAIVLEAPYKSRPGMAADVSAQAYNSGRVAREAELLRDHFEKRYTVIEHDPAEQGSKWDSSFARKIVGDWEGPDTSDTRDSIRLLFFYNFI